MSCWYLGSICFCFFLKLLYFKYQEMQTQYRFKHLVLKKYPFVSVLGVLLPYDLSLHQAGLQVNSWKVSGRSVSLWPVWICACGVRMAILAGAATQHWLSFLRATLYKHIIRSRLWGCICGKIKKREEGGEKSQDRLWGNMFTASIGRWVQLRWPHRCYYGL